MKKKPTLPSIERYDSFDQDDLPFTEGFVLIDADDDTLTRLPSLSLRAHSMPIKSGLQDEMMLKHSSAKYAWPADKCLPEVIIAAKEKKNRDRFFRSSIEGIQSMPDLVKAGQKKTDRPRFVPVRLEPLECKDVPARTPTSVAKVPS